MKIVYIPYSHGTSFFEHIIKVHLQTQLKASRKVSLVSVSFFCNFFEWLWIFVNLCESLYTLNVCVCAVTLSECPCIVPCSTHWCACIHNPSVVTRFIDLPLYYHTWWCSCQCFFYLCVFRELVEALLSLWTDWRRRGLAGYQLGGSTLLHTSEFKGQLAATESHHSVSQLF